MYGDNAKDPVIKYYDQTFAVSSPAEIQWYLRKIKQSGAPALDLGCGTGRIAIELARNNLEVIAIDNSPGMLEVFKQKLAAETPAVQEKIHIEKQAMESFNLDKKFKTIFCCDSFFHNLTIVDQKNCLNSVYKSLSDNGLFLFNIHNNPNPEFLYWASSPSASRYRRRGEYQLIKTAESLLIKEALFHNVLEQIIETKLHFIKTNSDGLIIEDSYSSWKSRYTCKFEMIHLLELTGFEIQSIVGNYLDEPVTVGSQLIFTCKKK